MEFFFLKNYIKKYWMLKKLFLMLRLNVKKLFIYLNK